MAADSWADDFDEDLWQRMRDDALTPDDFPDRVALAEERAEHMKEHARV